MQIVRNILYRYDIGIRLFFFTLTVFLCLTFLLLHMKLAMAASIKNVSVIEDSVIRLGDLFDNVPDKAHIVLGHAPSPGKDIVIGAPALSRVALSYDVKWTPQGYQDQVIIRRSASVIAKDNIDTILRKHLRSEGINDKFEITYLSGAPEIILPPDLPGTADVSEFIYNHNYDRFQATLVAPNKENPLRSITIHARIDRLIDVPVLKTRMTNGDIISKQDIDIIQVKMGSLQPDILINTDKLIGKTPSRILMPYKPVRDAEIQQPTLIQRGASITILYKTGAMELTVRGRAMEDGAAGDIIRILNIDSNRNIQGLVLENGIVEVGNV